MDQEKIDIIVAFLLKEGVTSNDFYYDNDEIFDKMERIELARKGRLF